jgi:hypothetical protein
LYVSRQVVSEVLLANVVSLQAARNVVQVELSGHLAGVYYFETTQAAEV